MLFYVFLGCFYLLLLLGRVQSAMNTLRSFKRWLLFIQNKQSECGVYVMKLHSLARRRQNIILIFSPKVMFRVTTQKRKNSGNISENKGESSRELDWHSCADLCNTWKKFHQNFFFCCICIFFSKNLLGTQ